MKRLAAIGCALVLVGCSSTSDLLADTSWQITHVYDDPGLPTAPAKPTAPPTLVLGRTSYTGSSQCGQWRGELTWVDDTTADFEKPDILRTTDCTDDERVFDQRLRRQVRGPLRLEVKDDALRGYVIGKTPAGQAPGGFAAVPSA
ncbi:hypothetical protein KRX51_08195 [Corynebacterium sp. TAE3-ERU12]|uniref:hypothetical protein n=1 Tax=Corynebacterium sp. TAE3-ERU12 TaxID=2849491 RepID=UPI001C4428C8|nr:hypothetical protein [Corynebacterium sp. TAE3-ERU12]MBV7295887.1 hypothetical protein [Corynebacterium sp. TAE3-ERU12]